MESLGIIEMLEWYVVGFSATLGLLHLISKLNILKGRERKPVYVDSSSISKKGSGIVII